MEDDSINGGDFVQLVNRMEQLEKEYYALTQLLALIIVRQGGKVTIPFEELAAAPRRSITRHEALDRATVTFEVWNYK